MTAPFNVEKHEQFQLNKLSPYPNNAKLHTDEQVKHIARSIQEFGFQQPIVCDEDGVIIIGHGRLLAAKKLNLDSAPVWQVRGMSDAQKKYLRLVDNHTNAETGFDDELFKTEVRALLEEGFNINEMGLDYTLADFVAGPGDAEQPLPELPSEPFCKDGDVWTVGKHRLICGDSTKAWVVQKLFEGGGYRRAHGH